MASVVYALWSLLRITSVVDEPVHFILAPIGHMFITMKTNYSIAAMHIASWDVAIARGVNSQGDMSRVIQEHA